MRTSDKVFLSSMETFEFDGSSFLVFSNNQSKIFIHQISQSPPYLTNICSFKCRLKSCKYLLKVYDKYLYVGTRRSRILQFKLDDIMNQNYRLNGISKSSFCGYFPNFYDIVNKPDNMIAPIWKESWSSSSNILLESLITRRTKVFVWHSQCVDSIRFVKKRGYLVTSGHDSLVIISNMQSSKIIRKFDIFSSEGIFDLCFHEERLFLGTDEGNVAEICLKNMKVRKLVSVNFRICHMFYDISSKKLYVVGMNDYLSIIDC